MNTLLGHALKPTPYANGGKVSPAMAALRRLKSKREAATYAQQQLDAANEKAGKSTFFGSLGGLAGGLGIPALAGALGFTPVGLPLAVLAGLGTAGGAYLGKKKGYGKDVDIDEDMRYGGSEFLGEGGLDRQVVAQDAFTDAFGRDSVISGVKAGLTAGLDKTGGMYGSAGKFGQKLTGAGLGSSTGAALIPSYTQSFAMDTGLDTAGVAGEGALSGTGSVLDMGGYGDLSSSITQPKSGFDPSTTFGNLTGGDAPLVTELSDYGSVEEALNAPIFSELPETSYAAEKAFDAETAKLAQNAYDNAFAQEKIYQEGLRGSNKLGDKNLDLIKRQLTTPSSNTEVSLLPDQMLPDLNLENEFNIPVEQAYQQSLQSSQDLGALNKEFLKQLNYYNSPEGRKEQGLPAEGYFQDLLKQSRNRAKERLFPQDSFNINNLLAMLGNN